MRRIPHVRAGDPITADLFNEVSERLERFANLSTTSPYIRLWESPYGKQVALAIPQKTRALLSGSSSPYSFTEVRDGPGGTWVSMPNGDSGSSNLYEINGKAGLAGKVVPITWTSAGDWRFAFIGFQSCGWRINVLGCNSLLVPGVTIELRQSGVLIDSGTSTLAVVDGVAVTIGGSYAAPPTVGFTILAGAAGSGATATAIMKVGSITRISGGSGYTNGTGYVGAFSGGGGTGATFSFDVSGGVIQNTLTILAGGSNYTSAPTPDFSAAGAGTGATATIRLAVDSISVTSGGSGYNHAPNAVTFTGGSPTVSATATASISASWRSTVPQGSYDITVVPQVGSGFTTFTGTRAFSCSGSTDDIDNVTFAIDTVNFRCGCAGTYPVPLVVGGTDFQGPITLTYDITGTWRSPLYTATDTVWATGCTTTSGTYNYRYIMDCFGGGYNLKVTWGSTCCLSGGVNVAYKNDPGSLTQSGAASTFTENPFQFTGTMPVNSPSIPPCTIASPGNAYVTPGGGSVITLI